LLPAHPPIRLALGISTMATSSFTYYCPSDNYLADRFRCGIEATHVSNGDTKSRARLESPLAWTREDIQTNVLDECVLRLSAHDVLALEAAAESHESESSSLAS
jgi:hypothetical protein